MASTNATPIIIIKMIHEQNEFMLSSNPPIRLEDRPNLGYKNWCDMPICFKCHINVYFDVSIVSIRMDIKNVSLHLGCPLTYGGQKWI